jgi:hypothetical protein
MAKGTLSRILIVARVEVFVVLIFTILLTMVAVKFTSMRNEHQPGFISTGALSPAPAKMAWFGEDSKPREVKMLNYLIHQPRDPVSHEILLQVSASYEPADDLAALASGLALLAVGALIGASTQYIAVRYFEGKSPDILFP